MYKKVKFAVTSVTIFWKTHKVKCKPYQPNSDPKYFKGHYFSNQTKCKPKPPRRSFDLYEANQMETKRKNFEKNHIFQDKKYTENVNYTRVRMDTMLTPSKIGTKIRCIITCCVRGNVDEDVDDGCKSDTDDEWTSFNINELKELIC